MPEDTNRRKAYEAAARQAIGKLAKADLRSLSIRLGLPAPSPDGSLAVTLLGRDLVLASDFRVLDAVSGADAHPFDRLLMLHYLGAEGNPRATGEFISFRDLPSGLFYWNPFRARSAALIEKIAGNDIDLLRSGLGEFDTDPMPAGDVGAAVHAIGVVRMALVYRRGDDEFPPDAEILFDAVVKRVYGTEDAAVLAERFAARLIGAMKKKQLESRP